jgi:hypothetical protein
MIQHTLANYHQKNRKTTNKTVVGSLQKQNLENKAEYLQIGPKKTLSPNLFYLALINKLYFRLCLVNLEMAKIRIPGPIEKINLILFRILPWTYGDFYVRKIFF